MIVGVAFLHESTGLLCTLPKPYTHSDIYAFHYIAKGIRFDPHFIQGFVDDKGKFYNRRQAAKYVIEIGQELTEYAKTEYKFCDLEILFSEDLW